MERVTREKEEEENRERSRQMLCWSKVADSNSRVQDRNHSTKGKKQSCLWQRREKKHTHTHSVWHRLRHLTRQVKSKRGSKIRKVEVATQKGWLKIHLDWKWGARREKHDVGEKHLQASDDNRLWHMWGQVLGAHTSWTLPSTTESFNLLRTQKLEYNVCLLPFVCTRLYTCAFRLHCEYWVG